MQAAAPISSRVRWRNRRQREAAAAANHRAESGGRWRRSGANLCRGPSAAILRLYAAASGLITVPLRTGLDVGIDKFQPLGVIGLDLNSLSVRRIPPTAPCGDLVAAAKANPKSINVGIISRAATAHRLICIRLEQLTGARFNLVSFKSGTDAAAAVLGGHVHAPPRTSAKSCLRSKAGRCACSVCPAVKRLAGLPNVPTLKEQGFDMHAGGFRGFVAPAGDTARSGGRCWETDARQSAQERRRGATTWGASSCTKTCT